MASEQLMFGGGPRYVQMQTEPSPASYFISSSQQGLEFTRIFDDLPKATIVSVSRPDPADISPMLLTYTIEFQYKQPSGRTNKIRMELFKAYLSRDMVREWLQNLGIGDHTAVVQDDDEPDDDTAPLHHDEITRSRDVPSSAALPIIRPALGRQNSMSELAKVAMQGYLNHFLGNMDLVNSRE
ncbi:phospholipase D, partial [Sarracenia purpurea var. burkii]